MLAGAATLSGCFGMRDDAGTEHTPNLSEQSAGSLRSYNPAQPWRVMIAGDSLSQGFAQGVTSRIRTRELHATAIDAGRISSGLARGDFYDWPQELRGLIARHRPDVIVFHVGTNDRNAIYQPGGSIPYRSDQWQAAYANRIAAVMDVASPTPLIFLGPAPVGEALLNAHIKAITPLFAAAAETRPGVYFLPLARTFANPDGSLKELVLVGNESVRVRANDGVHFTPSGYALVGNLILDQIGALYADFLIGGTA